MVLTREEKIAKARELRAEGLTWNEVGKRLGCSASYAGYLAVVAKPLGQRECRHCGADLTGTHGKRIWCSDRCRKDALYGGTCADCGGPTDGVKSGKNRPAERCAECARNVNAERNELLREMWEADEPTWYIAEKLGMPETAVLDWVDRRRRRYGEQLTRRRLGGTAEERKARHRKMVALRAEGVSDAQIAQAVGMSSADAVKNTFRWLRNKGWPVPQSLNHKPAQRQPASAKEIARLRVAGLSNEEIARELGYASAASLASRVWNLRQQGFHIPEAAVGRPPELVA